MTDSVDGVRVPLVALEAQLLATSRAAREAAVQALARAQAQHDAALREVAADAGGPERGKLDPALRWEPVLELEGTGKGVRGAIVFKPIAPEVPKA